MHNEASPTDRQFECPRCGYDLRGAMLQWTDACPIQQKCNECGLNFLCRDVLRPRYHAPKWLIEVEVGWKKRPIQIVLTFLRAWFPPLFWSRIGMAMPFHWRRLAFGLIAMIAIAFGCSWLSLAVVAAATFEESSAELNDVREVQITDALLELIEAQQLREHQTRLRTRAEVPSDDHVDSIESLIDELNEFDPSDHFFEHVATQLFSPLSRKPVRGDLSADAHRRFIGGPSRIRSSPWLWRGRVPTPRRTTNRLLPEHRLSRLTENGAHVVPIGWMAIMVGMPIYLIALPMTRRKAKVQMRHIARVAAYSVVFPLSFLLICGVVIAIQALRGRVDDQWFWWTSKAFYWVILPWAALWWFCAIRQYLRLPHAAAIVATGFIILFGLGPGLIELLNPHTFSF